jgi:hypothetical protein
VAIDSNKNIYAAGYQYGGVEFNYGGNATATAGFTGSNSVLVKYTADGEAQWAKTVTNVGKGSQFNSVALDNDRNIYVAGYQNGTGQYDYGNGQTATATGGSDGSNAVLVKYNLSGEAQWAKTVIGSVSFSRFTSVAVVSYGFGSGIYTVGSQDGKGQYTYGANATATGTASHDNSVLVKYAANGMAQWAKTLTAGDNNSYFYSVALDNTGNIYAAGFQNGTGAYSYGDYQTAAGGFTERNSVLVKYRQQ